MKAFSIGTLAAWYHLAKSEKPKARVLVVHGLGEHSGRHKNTTDFLIENHFEVVRFDLRGAGESGGRRQWVESFQEYIDDVNSVYNWIQRACEPLPLFVLGHSLGGAISLTFASYHHRSLAGLVLSAPAYLVGRAYSPFVLVVGRFLSKFVPKARLPSTSRPDGISRDEKVVEEFLNDPLSCHFNTLQQGQEILDALPQLPQRASQITCPTTIIHGSMDQIIRMEGSFDLLMKLPAKDKTLYIVPGGYHEPHNDLEKETYFSYLERWLNQHLKPTPHTSRSIDSLSASQ